MSFMWVLAIVCFITLLNVSHGLQCYHCFSSPNSTECGENPSLSESDTNLILSDCRACEKGTYVSNTRAIYARICSNVTNAVEGCSKVEKKSVFHYKQYRCYCTTDLCNTAQRTHAHVVYPFIPLCLGFLLWGRSLL